MNPNVEYVLEERIRRTLENLQDNNFNAYFAQSKEDVYQVIEQLVTTGDTVSVGGSTTLIELGLIDYLRKNEFTFLDRYEDGLTSKDVEEIYKKTFFADAFFVSSNAITEAGELYNVDGRGNRVAAMIYGPQKVIVIAGVNKIVKDLDDAVRRVEETAAPANTRRLDLSTPCKTLGYCTDCQSDDRICNKYSVIRRDFDDNRFHVILINEPLGF